MRPSEPSSGTSVAGAGVLGAWTFDSRAGVVLDKRAAKLMARTESSANKPLAVDVGMTQIYLPDQEAAAAHWARVVRTGGAYVSEFRVVVDPDDEIRWVLALGRLVRDGDGVVKGSGIFIDATDDPLAALATTRRRAGAASGHTIAREADPLSEAAACGIQVRTALDESGHSALRLAADLLLWEINTALAERLSLEETIVPGRSSMSC